MPKTEVHKIDSCRVCGNLLMDEIYDFGIVPLADKLTLTPSDRVMAAPLTLLFCPDCYHLQIGEDVDPEILFNDHYPYYSSRIPEVVDHFNASHEAILNYAAITKNYLVIEIASNDGVFLKLFKEQTEHLVAIEPSTEHAGITKKMGIKTYSDFFNLDAAVRIEADLKRKANLVLANNVLAHVPDPVDFVHGLASMLAPDGLLVIEVPHSLNIIANNSYDVIFHQHYSYFNLHSLKKLFYNAGLTTCHLDKVNTQGGSYRLYIRHEGVADNSVLEALQEEKTAGLDQLTTYLHFSEKIKKLKNSIRHELELLKRSGKMVVGYGAPGKAATFLNHIGIDDNLLSYLVDISQVKQQKYFPFTGLKIHPVAHLYEEVPDYVLILAWNYTTSILKALHPLRESGVRFLVPYPELKEV